MRFGTDTSAACQKMDSLLAKIAPRVKNFGLIYLVDNKEIPDFNTMYELYDPCTVMFFFRNKLIQVDFGTGNNNKLNFEIGEKQELIDIVEVAYRAASKGKGKATSPKDYSCKLAY